MAYNEEPRPRVLFIGFDEEEFQGTGVLELFPTTRIIEIDELGDLHQGEYDIAVTYEVDDLSGLEPHLYIVSLGGRDLGWQQRDEHAGRFGLQPNSSVAKELELGPVASEDERLKTLIEQTLIPIYSQQAKHHTLYSAIRVSSSYNRLEKLWFPTVMDRDGEVLAGFAQRSETIEPAPELWYFPASISLETLKQWLEHLVDRWSAVAPAMLPNTVSWKQSQEWQSEEENRIDDAVATLKEECAEAVKKYSKQLAEFEQAKRVAATSADGSLRSLLTSQGETLKNAVYATLEGFGFQVVDVDKKQPANNGNKADKLEDLQVTTTRKKLSAGWIALVEVRGYTKGAKVNDLLRLSRFTKRYMQESGGTAPDAVWYVVNHDLRSDPKNRNSALKANPVEVKEFGKDQGLVIDTVELFKLKKLVDIGTITKDQAREQLMDAIGYFKVTSPGK